MTRTITSIAGILCILLGGLWVLQGASILGGSVMSGDHKWLVIGIILALVGLGVIWWGNRRPA